MKSWKKGNALSAEAALSLAQANFMPEKMELFFISVHPNARTTQTLEEFHGKSNGQKLLAKSEEKRNKVIF